MGNRVLAECGEVLKQHRGETLPMWCVELIEKLGYEIKRLESDRDSWKQHAELEDLKRRIKDV